MQKAKTEDFINYKHRKYEITSPQLKKTFHPRKIAISFDFGSNDEKNIQEFNLLSRSNHTDLSIRQSNKACSNVHVMPLPISPIKQSIRPKWIELPALRNSQEGHKSKFKSQTSSISKKSDQKVTKVIKDCKMLVKMVQLLKKKEQLSSTPPSKNLNEIRAKNIFIPPTPDIIHKRLATQPDQLPDLMKLLKIDALKNNKKTKQQHFSLETSIKERNKT